MSALPNKNKYMISHSRYHHIDSAIIYGFAVLAVLILSNVEKSIVHKEIKKETVKIFSSQKVVVEPFFKEEAFSNIAIRGKAYVVYDIVDKKIIFGKNVDTVLPLASITKVMTMVTARMHNSNKKQLTVASGSVEGEYDLGLKKGQVWNLDEILKYTLVFSSNDAAQVIADGLGGRNFFVSQMNTDAVGLGLDLHFTHPAGSDEFGKVGGLGSAHSVAKLLAVARREFPEILEATTKTRTTVTASTGRIIGIPNTNQNVYDLAGLELSKTGFTDLAGGNLVVVVDIALGHPVAIVVLGSTREERFSDVATLYKALQNSIQK